jgi:DeoR/GlpR family transcriptional regulator of sugar metabolism
MKVPVHVVNARRARLTELVTREGYLPVAEVCSRLGISEATARRDLAALAKANTITRTHGGALIEYNQRFPSFRERQGQAEGAKRRIARAARTLLQPGMTVWFDGGTTSFQLAELLSAEPVADLVIVTNSMPVADALADRDDISVHLLGGQYFRRSSMLLGGRVLANLAEWRFDLACLGAEGLDAAGIWNSQDDIVALQRAVQQRAPCSVVLADAGKIGRRAPAFLGDWHFATHLISDATATQLTEAGVTCPPKHLITA